MTKPRQSSSQRRFMRYHLPLLIYAALILGISSIPYLSTPGLRTIGTDKIAHFVEYALLAALVYRSFSNLRSSLTYQRAFWYSLGFLLTFAMVDETVQRFTPGRDPSLADYLFDLAGGLAVLVLLRYRSYVRARTVRPDSE